MKKVSIYFAVSDIFPIFAPAILEKTGGNARFDILQDSQKGADLIEFGKSILIHPTGNINKNNEKTKNNKNIERQSIPLFMGLQKRRGHHENEKKIPEAV